MATLVNGTPFQYIIVALAIAWVSITITKSSIFKPFRDSLNFKIFNCPYCLAPWLIIFFAWKFGIVGMFAVVGLSSIFSLPILLFLERLDATGT